MRPSDTWVCVALERQVRFFRCDPGCDPEPVLGFGLPAHAAAEGFAGRVAGQLDRAAAQHLYDHLLLVGPPQILDEVDQALGPAAREAMVGQVHRVLSHATPRELLSHLGEWLPH